MTPTNGALLEGCLKDYLCAKLHLVDLATHWIEWKNSIAWVPCSCHSALNCNCLACHIIPWNLQVGAISLQGSLSQVLLTNALFSKGVEPFVNFW